MLIRRITTAALATSLALFATGCYVFAPSRPWEAAYLARTPEGYEARAICQDDLVVHAALKLVPHEATLWDLTPPYLVHVEPLTASRAALLGEDLPHPDGSVMLIVWTQSRELAFEVTGATLQVGQVRWQGGISTEKELLTMPPADFGC